MSDPLTIIIPGYFYARMTGGMKIEHERRCDCRFDAVFGKSSRVLLASMILGLIVCYAFGTAWFVLVYTKNTGAIGLSTALAWCVFPYILPDIIKIFLAMQLTRRLRPLLFTE